jgi:hypothetical protein
VSLIKRHVDPLCNKAPLQYSQLQFLYIIFTFLVANNWYLEPKDPTCDHGADPSRCRGEIRHDGVPRAHANEVHRLSDQGASHLGQGLLEVVAPTNNVSVHERKNKMARAQLLQVMPKDILMQVSTPIA